MANLSKELIEGLQDAREAKIMASMLQAEMAKGFRDMKDSFRYDMQNIVNSNIKISVLDALKEHYEDKVIPLEGRIGVLENDINTTRIQIGTLKKTGLWVWGCFVFVLSLFGITQ